MSYSYLKNVFPKFEYTTDFENTKFNTINNDDDKLDSFTKSLIASDLQGLQGITESSAAPYNNTNHTIHKDLAPNYIYGKSRQPVIETFQDNLPPTSTKESSSSSSCDLYIKHVMECNKCRNMFVKQWNLDSDRIRNEEIMEIVTYVIFGIVLLLLFDTIKNK